MNASKRTDRVTKQDFKRDARTQAPRSSRDDTPTAELKAQNTDLRESQHTSQPSRQEFIALYDHAPIGYLTIDAQGLIRRANLAASELLGVDREQLPDRPLSAYVSPADQASLSDHLANALSEKKSVRCELRFASQNGTAFYARVTSSPSPPTMNSDAEIFLTLVDLPDHLFSEEFRRNQEQSLLGIAERADFLERELASVHQEKLEALGQLAGGVAHDFNNRLAAIMAFAECALLTDDLPQLIEEDLEGIRDASLRARNLIREVLTFARKRPPIRAQAKLDQYLTSALDLVQEKAPSNVRFSYAGDTSASVFVDEGQIEQAVGNILTNSVQAIGADEGHVQISVKRTELEEVLQSDGGFADSGSFWCISIRDDGPGIDTEVIARIFDPFFTTHERSGGCGMGLATCLAIAELHGGILEVSSEPNLGAEFRLFLPADRQDSQRSTPPSSVPKRFEGFILLVDDEELVLRSSQRLLIGLGARVETCSNPEEALKRIDSAPDKFDAVITDLTMPEMLGTQLAYRINQVAPRLPILLLTGNRARISPESLERIELAGIMEKPLSMREASEALGQLAAAARNRSDSSSNSDERRA